MTRLLKRAKEIGIRRFLKKATFYDEVYAIGIRPKMEYINGRINTSIPFSLLDENNDYWMADPLLFNWNNKDWLFVELFDKATHRGSIALIDPDSPTGRKTPKNIINETYHMSFPMVFEWEDEYYMIPETSENHSINLYKAKSMPDKWGLIKSFPTDGLVVDSVIIEKKSNQITILASETNPNNELQVRFVKYVISKANDDFTCTIEPPEQVFNLNERNGGYPLSIDNQMYLVTQSSSDIDYGINVSLSEFSGAKLTNKQILNKTNIQINGLSVENIIGIHTYSRGNTYEVIDVRYLRFDPLLNIRRVLRHFKK